MQLHVYIVGTGARQCSGYSSDLLAETHAQ